jgi:hypothetical protein
MVNWDKVADYERAARNPANPTGLTATYERVGGGVAAGPQPGGFTPWTPTTSMAESAYSWYSGANPTSGRNGWDTDFYNEMFRQVDHYQRLAAERDDPTQFYKWLVPGNQRATGVAMWDDPEGRFKFGDVFVKGKVQKGQNLYDVHDEYTADLLMGELMFNRVDKQRMFEDDNRVQLFRDKVESERKRGNERAVWAGSAKDYKDDVEKKQETIREHGGGALMTLAGGATAGGMAWGGTVLTSMGLAAAGFSWTGPGAIGAAVIAGVATAAGLAGGYMNQDQLTEITARAWSRTEQAAERYSTERVEGDGTFNRWQQVAAVTGSAAMGVGELGMKFMAPLSNVTQGIVDASSEGGIGDGESEFYAYSSTGRREANKWVRGLDLVATVGDSMLQFANPFGRMFYMGNMAAVAGGKFITGLGGTTFNDSRGAWDNIESIPEGLSLAGSVGIDVLQMGVAGKLHSASEKARAWAKGPFDDANKVADDLYEVTLNGRVYKYNDKLEVVSSKTTLEALVPSEFLRWVPTGWMAQRMALRDGRKIVTRDDLFQAAQKTASYGTRLGDAVILGWAEGGEEVFQAVLDPMTVGETATWDQIFEAGMYGAASGIGMGMSGSMARPSIAQQQEARAKVNVFMRTGMMPDDAQWNEFWKNATPEERARMATATKQENEDIKTIVDTLTDLQRTDDVHSATIGAAGAEVMKTDWETSRKKALQEGNGSLVTMGWSGKNIVTPHGVIERSEFPANAGILSAAEFMNQMRLIYQGNTAARQNFEDEKVRLDGEMKKATESKNQDAIDEVQRLIDANNVLLDETKDLLGVNKQILAKFEKAFADLTSQPDPAERSRIIKSINTQMRAAFSGEWVDNAGNRVDDATQELIRRSVELKIGRHPYMDRGSFAVKVMQISEEMTKWGINNTIYTHQGGLKAQGADHDGDTTIPLHEIYLPRDRMREMRRGTQYVSTKYKARANKTDTSPMDPSRDETFLEMIADTPDSEQTFLNYFKAAHDSGPGTDRYKQLNDALTHLSSSFQARYAQSNNGPIEDAVLSKALDQFKVDVRSGVVSARQTLVETLFNHNAEGLFEMGDRAVNGEMAGPEMLWMLNRINIMFDSVQQGLAHIKALQPQNAPVGNPARVAKERDFQNGIARLNAANAGQALSMLGSVVSVRQGQVLHYSPFLRSLTDAGYLKKGSGISQQQFDLANQYAAQSGQWESDVAHVQGRNAIQNRVNVWIDMLVEEIMANTPSLSRTPAEIRMLLANMSVPNLVEKDGTYTVTEGSITLLQLLLRKSLAIEEVNSRKALPDDPIHAKIKKLKALTVPKGPHSVTHAKAVLEVFGDRQLHELVGDSSMYIAPSMTLNQLKMHIIGMGKIQRDQTVARLHRSPAYIKPSKLADPPWGMEVLETGEVSAFSMMVDSIASVARTMVKDTEDADQRAHNTFTKGLSGLQREIANFRTQNALPLMKKYGKDVSNANILKELLRARPELAMEVAKIIPKASQLGVFEVDGHDVKVAKWVDKMLLAKPDEAAKIWFVHTKLAELNQLAGTKARGLEEEESIDADTTAEAAGKIHFDRIESRFLQLLHHLSQQPDQMELMKLLKLMEQPGTLQDFFDDINEQDAWRMDRERLFAYHDDVKMFEVDFDDVWNSGTPGTVTREALQQWGKKLSVYGKRAAETEVIRKNNESLLANMVANRKDPTVSAPHATYNALLEDLIKFRRKFPDTQGQISRDQVMALMQHALARTHDKGKGDPNAAPFGEATVTMDGFGWADGLRQEANAMTMLDFADVATNLTKLVEGPVRIMMPDGSSVRIDVSDGDQALAMLADPRTQPLAMAILAPTVRDVDNNGVLQTYIDLDGSHVRDIGKMLEETVNGNVLFAEKSEWSDKVKQAHRYIGLIEGHVRKAVANGTPEERSAGYMPIMNMINDFLVAYTHGPANRTVDKEMMRQKLIVEVADAIKDISRLDPALHGDLLKRVKEKMYARLTDDAGPYKDLFQSEMEKEFIHLGLMQKAQKYIQHEQNRIDAEHDILNDEKRNATDPARIQEINDKLAELKLSMTALSDSIKRLTSDSGFLELPKMTLRDLNSMTEMFTLDPNADPAAKAMKRVTIMQWLESGNRINRFRPKEHIDLYHKAKKLIFHDPGELATEAERDQAYADQITDKEWQVLGGWAMSAYTSDLMSRGASTYELPTAMLGDDALSQRRYFDISQGYLAEPLFDPNVLHAARELAMKHSYGGTDPTISSIEKKLTEGTDSLLSEKRIGKWSDRIPVESMKARQIMLTAPVGAAVAIEGNDPKEMESYVSSSLITWKKPEAVHHSQHTLTGKATSSAPDLLKPGFPESYVKLQGHFLRGAKITDLQGNEIVAANDFFEMIGRVNTTNDAIEQSGYRVFTLQRLNQALNTLRSNGILTTDFKIELDYVDVDKMPATKEWANNIFFDGVGREDQGGSGVGAIAALFFGVNGLNKLGQQQPLDMAAKKGKQFRAHVTTMLDEVEQMESQGTISHQLMLKAMHMWSQDYPTGSLLPMDLPSLHKLMRMRHVVKVTQHDGSIEFVWPEKIISEEQALGPNQSLPYQDVQLIPLSDSVAQTLRGAAGYMGVSGKMIKPVFQLKDLMIQPDLSLARLKALGITRLGETTELAESLLATTTALPRARQRKSKEAKALDDRWTLRIKKWVEEREETSLRRLDKRKKGKGTLDITRINQENIDRLTQAISLEALQPLFNRMGVPHSDLSNGDAITRSQAMVARLGDTMTDTNNMVFLHDHKSDSDPSQGRLSAASLRKGFDRKSPFRPMYGDVVVIDMQSILDATGQNHEKALELALDVVKAYSEYGVTIALMNPPGEQDMRVGVSQALANGWLGYEAMAHSGHIFSPMTPDSKYEQAQRAAESTLTEVVPMSARGLVLGLASNGLATDLSENNTHIWAEKDEQFNRVTHTIMPVQMDATKQGRRPGRSYNVPTAGIGRDGHDQRAKLTAELPALLTNDEVVKTLKKMTGGDAQSNPKNARIRKYHKDSDILEPGIMSFDDALEELINNLQNGIWPTDVGTTIRTGTMIPLVSKNGDVYIYRVGFEHPSIDEMTKMHNQTPGDLASNLPMKLSISKAKVDKKQSLPPPFEVVSVTPDVNGLSVIGKAVTDSHVKMGREGVGFKDGMTHIPGHWKFPADPMKATQDAQGIHVTRFYSETSTVAKGAWQGFCDNFRDIFTVTGIDFRDDLLDAAFGTNRDPADASTQWNTLQEVFEIWSKVSKNFTAEEIARAMDSDTVLAGLGAEVNAIGRRVAGTNWTDVDWTTPNRSSLNPQQDIFRIVMVTLAAPGMKLEHVLSTSGLMTVKDRNSPANSILRMPPLFTDALNSPKNPELRDYLIGKINSRMPRDAAGNLTHYFDRRLRFHQRIWSDTVNGGKGGWMDVEGTLQVHMPIPFDENHQTLTQASLQNEAPASPHIARTVESAIGGLTATRPLKRDKDGNPIPERTKLDEIYGDNEVMRFDNGDGETIYNLIRNFAGRSPYSPYDRKQPMEVAYVEEADAQVRQYATTAPWQKWSKQEKAAARSAAVSMIQRLNLDQLGGSEMIDEIDFLVRQFLGAPAPSAQQQRDGTYQDQLTSEMYVQAVELMMINIQNNWHPLHGAAVPLEHESFWKMVYNAQLRIPAARSDERWAPAALEGGKTTTLAKGWDEWVVSLHGQLRESDSPFHSMFGTALDGFYHTYQGATDLFMEMDLSVNAAKAAKLMDEKTNRYYLSISEGHDSILRNPVVIDGMLYTLETLTGSIDPLYTADTAATTPDSTLAAQIEKQREWLAGKKMAKQKRLSVKQYAKVGAAYQENSRVTSALLHNIMHLSIANRLFNPQLYMSAILEVPFRSQIEHFTNFIYGAHQGAGSRQAQNAREEINKLLNVLRRLDKREEVVVQPYFTNQQRDMLDQLVETLSHSNELFGELYKEMSYQMFVNREHRTKLGSGLETMAHTAARIMADPKWGMTGKAVVRRYIDAAWEVLSLTDSNITVEQFVEMMRRDPLWLKKMTSDQRGGAHKMAMNRVAQNRGAKQTLVAQHMMKRVEAMTSSSSWMINTTGHAVKIPFAFTRFNMNMFMTVTGLQAFDTMAAMWLDGKQKPEYFKRMAARARGEAYQQDTENRFDYSDVLDGVDLSRAFVRGAVTQTQFFIAGFLASNLGLGGEDEEERKRRKLAELLNIPYYHDPYKANNDFRMKDAIFLDNIPILNGLFKDPTGRSAIQPHWVMKQFLSPIMGMQRFFDTGNFNEVRLGFWDAAAAIPNSITRLYREVDVSARMLMMNAKDLDLDTPEGNAAYMGTFAHIVGMYERAIFENNWINSIRNAKDEYDRNPWLIPATDEEGNILRVNGMGVPEETDALHGYVKPDGTIGNAYLTREGIQATLHQYSENNAVAATILSLFTGGTSSTYLRRNMVPKTPTAFVDEATKSEAKALILAAWHGLGGAPEYSKMDIIKTLQEKSKAAGIWYDQDDIEAEADAIYASQTDSDYILSILDDEGRELIQKDGGSAVYRALWKGELQLGDASLRGVAIPIPMRKEIGEELLDDLIQKGVDDGMTQQQANYMANRLWYGDPQFPDQPGLKALLNDDRIPTTPKAEYLQANLTYVIGPDGKPWATPFEKQSLFQAITGIPSPHQVWKPRKGTHLDARYNVVDDVLGINTGQAGLIPKPIEPKEEEEKEKKDVGDDPLKNSTSKKFYPRRGSYGYRRYGYRRYGRGGYGGGGGGGYSSSPRFDRMDRLPTGTAARFDNVYAINTNTPLIRRSEVRRERITSERGRLKQWQ